MKRTLLALIACILTSTVASELITFAWQTAFFSLPLWAGYIFWPLSALSTFAGVAAGSFVARGQFLIPALSLWLLATTAGLVIGFKIQVAALPMSFLDYFARNLPAVGSTLIASACGLVVGRWLYGLWQARRAPNNSSKPTPLRGAA